jgi:hypothetical protein
MLPLLDVLLTILHFVIVLFNLFGWISEYTRRAHLISIILTAVSWFLLGIWFGIGYCPITEWQWQIKEKLGEVNLPDSFIKYYGDKITGSNLDPGFINTLTAVCFGLAAILSLYVNFFKLKKKKPVLNKRQGR